MLLSYINFLYEDDMFDQMASRKQKYKTEQLWHPLASVLCN